MLITLILITMGATWASDDAAVDDAVSADADSVQIEVQDTPTIKENTTVEKTYNSAKSAEDSASAKNGEILGATNDEDVLGVTWNENKNFSSTQTISSDGTIIDGAGFSATTSGNFRIYEVNKNNVIFQNINFVAKKNLVVSDANGGAAVLINNVNNIQFINCNFTGFKASGGPGGAISMIGSNVKSVTIDHCRFEGNAATNTADEYKGVGGAINIHYKDITVDNVNIQNSIFIDNYANSFGGAISVSFGYDNTNKRGVYNYDNRVNVYNCTFIGNKAYSEAWTGGGAISHYGRGTISGCNFINNTANQGGHGSGGAVYAVSTQGIEITHCNFTGNKATYLGGGLAFEVKNGKINYCNFINNAAERGSGLGLERGGTAKATNMVVDHCKFINHTGNQDMSSAIYWASPQVNINDSYFENNYAPKGAAIYLQNFDETNTNKIQTFITSNLTFVNNHAPTFSTISFTSSVTRFEMRDSVFRNNYVTNDNGGALNIPSTITTLVLSGCEFYGNNASDGNNGGAVYLAKGYSNFNMDNFVFEGNKASNSGAIYFAKAMPGLTISNSNFTDNKATSGNGGALIIPTADGTTFINCKFKGNNATSGLGGALYFNQKSNNIEINECVFDLNRAKTGGAVQFSANGVENKYTNIDIISSNFTYNTATGDGNYGGSAICFNPASDVDIVGCKFENNYAVPHGTVFFDQVDDINFDGCKFINNNASRAAAAIFLYRTYDDSNSTINNCTFDGNIALLESNGTVIHGGAIYLLGKNHKITKNTFKNNKINGNYGGAIYFDGLDKVDIIGNNFINNTAGRGGALHIKGTNIKLRDSVFDKNNATNQYGAVYISASTQGTSVYNCNFTNNYAETNHGALYFEGANTLTIDKCYFINDTAKGNYGALYFVSPSGTIQDSYFIGNNATNGGALYINGQGATITQSNFTNNYATINGGAIITGDASGITISHSNFTKNKADGNGGSIYFASNGGTISYCNFTSNNATNGGAVYFGSSSGFIKHSNFITNNATNGGAVYVVDGSTLNISDTTFKQNDADINGGAVYYGGSSTFGLKIYNDTFIGNTALNGGALDYLSSAAVPYRDFNWFEGEATSLGNNRYSWTHPNVGQIIYSSYFDGNEDYLMNVTAAQSKGTLTVLITITTSKRMSQTARVNITLIYANGTAIEGYNNKVLPIQTDSAHWINGDEYVQIILPLDEQIPASYNLTLGISDTLHQYKEQKFNYTVARIVKGGFETIQEAIDEATKNWHEGDPIPVVNLTNERYAYNPEFDEGPIIVNSPVTIIGLNNTIITALGYSRIFEINSPNVTFVNLTFTRGNANGNESSDDTLHGGAILWNGINGNIVNCTFDNNTAAYGGAVYWNATDGNVISSEFKNNNASEGGALFVNENTDKLTVDDSEFTTNTAVNDGGAIYMNGTGSEITGSQFYNNTADNDGGAVYVSGSNNNIIDSEFNDNEADNGGAVYWTSATGGVKDSEFHDNNATNGGAVYVDGDAYIKNSTFTSNEAINGAAIYLNNTSEATVISNDTFNQNTVTGKGGAIYIVDSEGSVENSTFNQNSAGVHGADICIDENSEVSLYNLTITNNLSDDASIYANSNVTIENTEINSDNAIIFNNGDSKVIGTVIKGDDAILINQDANVNLEGVNTTGSGDYAVSNYGTLYLDGNNFTDIILNNGNITSKTNTTVLGGETFEILINESIALNASIVDDNGNIIIIPGLTFVDNATFTQPADNNGKTYNGSYPNAKQGVYVLSVNNTGLQDNIIKSAILKVKDPNTNLTVTVEQENQGEFVIIKAKINVNEGTMGPTGNVTFEINGLQYSVSKNETEMVNETTFIATLILPNLIPDTYTLTATYNGDDTHEGCVSAPQYFFVNARDSNITVSVDNVTYGQNATATIKTNATNGTIKITVTGKDPVEIVMEGDTYVYDLGKLEPGNYTVRVDYVANQFYKASTNSTTFEVYKYDMIVDISETQFNQSATITVTLPSDADGDVKIFLNGEELENVIGPVDGVYTVVTDKLAVGNYTVNVTYAGNNKYYARDVNGTNFTVIADKDYEFNMTVTPQPVKFGENVTINITGPAGLEVNLTIDGKNKTVVLNETGTYVEVLENLTAGTHNVVANITGNQNYTSKQINETFTIDKATPEMTIDVTQPIAPNAPANITVTVGKNATGNVVIYIDGNPNVVEVINGTAVLPIDTSKPGNYNVTAQYFPGDEDNYESAKNMTGVIYTIDKYNTTITSNVTIGTDNHVIITVNVNSTADGNVTLYLSNNTNVTVNVNDGVATFDLGVVDKQGDYNFTATFNGDKNLNVNSTKGDFTVGGLNNYTINVTVSETQFGDNTTVTIKLPSGANGTLTVNINGTVYREGDADHPITQVGDGIYEIVTPALPVGDYNVNVTYVGDSRYADKNSTDNPFAVKTNSSYEFKVDVTPAPFGQNTTINITGPAGENVTVFIDGVKETVTLDENGTAIIKRDNLTAGPHNVVANITGNENYTSKQISETFTVPPATPEMTIDVTQPIAPTSPANITVTVGKNANGTVYIYIDGVPTPVEVINGTAVLAIDTSKPGKYNVTAQFVSDDDNYKSAKNLTGVTYTVDKYNTTITSDVSIEDDNHVFVTVNVNGTADGNVTLTLNNGSKYNATVKDGVATVDLGIFNNQTHYDYTVVYSGDKNFTGNSTTGEFTVGGLNNYTINVTVSETQFGDNTTVTIKLPSGANGTLTVDINGTVYREGDADHPITQVGDGIYEIVTPALPVGDYNVNVTYVGDSRYADKNSTDNPFAVKTNSSYELNVKVTPAPYGENTTINITGPAGLKVNVTIDNVTQTVTLDENGTAIIKRDNLTAGHHTVTANFTGDKNYTSKEASESFNIVPQTPDIKVIVPDAPVTPNSTANVTVYVGKNATGRVTIKINGTVIDTIDVINGTAVLPIENIQPGTYNVTAEFYGDSNYNGAVNNTGSVFEVDRYEPTVISVEPVVNDDNTVTVTVKLNETAGGKVTIEVNGTNYTADVIDGVATVEINKQLENDTYNLVTVYSGDKNFKNTTAPVEFEVSVLRNFNVTINITEGKYGENTTITVNVPAGADGNVTIFIDGNAHNATINPDGTATIELPLSVGPHVINATFENSTKYAAKNSTNYNIVIEPQDTYNFNVTVSPAPFGNDTVITVNAPAGVHEVNVTVDDELHVVPINSNGTGQLTLNNLTAGKHDVVATFAGNKNYTAASNSTSFNIAKQTPKMNVTISDNRVPNTNVTVTVEIGKNATGFVKVTVDGKTYDTVEVKDGVAQFNVTGLQPNEHTIDVKYLGDDNYNASDVVSNTVTMEKYNTTVEFIGQEIKPDNNVTILVRVNETAVNGIVTVKVGEDIKTGIVDENGIARVNLGILGIGEQTFTAVFNETTNFNENSTEVSFTVGKLENATIKVDIKEGEFGDNTTITVTVPEDVDGNVTIWVDGKPEVVPVTDGVAVLNVTPGVGPHQVNVTLTNDTKYANKELNGTNFTVARDSHYNFNVTVAPEDIKYGDEVTITVNAPAGVREVNLTIDGVTVPVTIGSDGKGEHKLSNLSAGDHTVIASFNGNENYTAINNSTSFNIAKKTSDIKVEVDSLIDAGGDVLVNVTVDENATGYISVTIEGVEKLAPIKKGKANVTFENSQPGEHNIIVKYLGDNNYTESTNDTVNFTTDVYATTMEVTTRIDENNNVTVIVKVNGTEGKVNVTLPNGTVVPADVGPDGIAEVNIGILPKGTHELNVTYSGDDNFAPLTQFENITVPALENYTLPVTAGNISYGGVAQVNVTLPEGANVTNLTFYVDDKEYTGEVTFNETTGIAQINVADLKAGNHTVKVVYAEDNFYAGKENSTTFNVATTQPDTFDVTASEPNYVGDVVNVTVKLPEDATGTVTVDVNGTKYVADVVNGTANITIPKLGNGTYDINVTYSGDDNYDAISEIKSVVVEKIDPAITANTTEIILGENAVISVTLPDDATGTVTITIGDVNVTSGVSGGLNNIIVPNVPAGADQTVTVVYNGDDKYAKDTTTTELTVKPKETKAEDFKVEDKGNGTIIVTVPEGATGKVNLTIGNETYEANITDGKAVFDIANKTNQTPGVHDITLTYTGDENNTAIEFNSTANVPKWESEVSLNIPTIRQGDVAKVNVTVTSPEGRGYTPNGTVRVEVDGKGYYGELKDGSVVVDVPGLSNGTHTVKVTYDGNDYYLPDSAEDSVTVQDPITVKVNGTGNGSEIVVQLPEGTNKTQVDVTIDNKTANDRLTIDENGTAKINLTGIEPGEHNLTIKYTDEDGTVSWVNTTINVPKWSSSVEASAAKIREGDPAVIKVKVSPDMTGEVKVEINGTGYIATIDENGEATIVAHGLGKGTHAGVVTYLGNNKYDPSNNTFTVTVQDPITVKVNGTGNDSEIVVQLPEGTNKTQVEVTIDNKTENDRLTIDENGTAKINLTGIEPGEHNLTIKYTDEDGTVSWVNTTINVPRWSSAVSASAKTIREGDIAVINIAMDANETGRILVNINGTGYYADLSNGKAVINAPGLKADTYNATVSYEGDRKYDPSNNTFQVVVQPPITLDINGTGNSSELIVKLPEGATANDVNITVDGNTTLPVTVDENGTARANLTGLEPGEHDISVKYVDPDGTVSYVNTTINVPRWTSQVNATAAKIREGDNAIIKVKVDSNETGTVYVDIDGTGYYGTLEDGVVTIVAPGIKKGTYTGNVTYLGDKKYDPSNNTFKLVVEPEITVDLEGAGDSSKVVIQLPENSTDANVTVVVDGKERNVTVYENGTAVVDLGDLPVGDHNVTVTYTDSDGTQSVVNKTIKIYKSINVADEIKRGWNSPFDAEAEFLDKEGHVLANTTVEFTVNGKTYNVVTDEKGIGKLTDSHLAIGKYDLTIKNPVTGETLSRNVTIVKRLIENKDVVTDYLAGKYYTVRAIGDDGEPVGAGEVIGITVNGVGYVIKTDKNGYGKLKINLVPKKYTIKAEYAKYKVTNKVTVKQTLKLVKKTVKAKKGKKIIIKAKLKWTNGKAIKGKKITIKFKGKKFSAKTNKKGIAKIVIKKKSVLKKLKKGKKYKFTAYYVKEKAKGKIKIKK